MRTYAILIFANMLEPQAKPFETTTGTGDTDMLSHPFGKQKSPSAYMSLEVSVGRNLLPHFSIEYGLNLGHHAGTGQG